MYTRCSGRISSAGIREVYMNCKYLGSIGRGHCNQCKTGHLHLRTQLLHIPLMYVDVFVCLFYKVWQFVTGIRYCELLFLFFSGIYKCWQILCTQTVVICIPGDQYSMYMKSVVLFQLPRISHVNVVTCECLQLMYCT